MLLRRSESDALVYCGSMIITKLKSSSSTEKRHEYVLAASTDVAKGTALIEEKPFLIAPWCRTQLRKAEIEGTRHLYMRNMTCFGCKKF